MNANLSSLLWEGFTVDSFTCPAPEALLIPLQPDPALAPSCRRCGHTDYAVHDVSVRRVLEPERHTLRRLIMDDFALFKGHRYVTVVVDADTQRVLWVGEGRSRVAVRGIRKEVNINLRFLRGLSHVR